MDDYRDTVAGQLLRDSFVWDNHACMPLRPDDATFLPQLERLRKVGVDAVTLNIGMDINSPDSHFEMLDAFHDWLRERSELYAIIGGPGEIESVRASGRLAVAFDVEGMGLLDDGDLSKIQRLRERGVFWMLIAYNNGNRAGGGCLDEEDTGLSQHGKSVLDEMRRVGMMVCCSHTGHRTAQQVMEHAQNPVIFSHSNPDSVYRHVRNIPDSLIKACADTGGVIGINGVGDFLGDGEDYASLLMWHIDHAVELVGADHVGISLDYVFDQQEVYDYIDEMREAFGEEMASQFSGRFAPPETLLPLADKMLAVGYNSAEIGKILGGNWLRVARAVAANAESP